MTYNVELISNNATASSFVTGASTALTENTHYQTLGVESSATREEIRQAWLRRTQDIRKGSLPPAEQTAPLQIINEAWEWFKTQERRTAYDAHLRAEKERTARRDADIAEQARRAEAEKVTRETAARAQQSTQTSTKESLQFAGYRHRSATWSGAIAASARRHWKFGLGVTFLYAVALVSQPSSRGKSVPEAGMPVVTKASANTSRRVKAPVRKARKKVAPSRRRASFDASQDATEMNRRELNRIKDASQGAPSPYRTAPDYTR
ncbi:hypothetical protein [Sphingomonas sp. PvP018]|uniref:J domain-containing protein n=1 Tax=Sphingomonas sp. PvP018 TaxID=2817852 RepID=UPI001AE1CC0F|nr:hypothetical protein [Sphingomonas sp. PvP018]MBP2512188.1 curved DNA-binding protein CbpA [Sphingomonas sp. PvP018]